MSTTPSPRLSPSHQDICCDDVHAASASASGSMSSSQHTSIGSSSSTPATSERSLKSPGEVHLPKDGIEPPTCPECFHGNIVNCDGVACDSPECDGKTECCEDPACEQVEIECEECEHPTPKMPDCPECIPATSGVEPIIESGIDKGPDRPDPDERGMDETEVALTEWMCSKEGCEAIEQYLRKCTEQNCHLPVIQPQLGSQSSSNVHYHMTPHTHPHAHTHIHGHDHGHGHTHFHTQMLPPTLDYMSHRSSMNSPNASWSMSASSTPHSVLPTSQSIDTTFSLPPSGWTDVVQATHTCHWQNCHLNFPSMPDLLAHVATDHLGAPGFSLPLLDLSQPVSSIPSSSTSISQAESSTAATPINTTHSATSSIDFSALQFGDYPTGQATLSSNVAASSITQPDVTMGGLFGSDGLLSCLWDDCYPLPTECSADPNEACPPHPVQSHPHTVPNMEVQGTVDTDLLHNHLNDHSHASHAHLHPHHTALPGTESFSPQVMLRHVLEEHLGVPSDILGWNELLSSAPLPGLTVEKVNKAHSTLHSKLNAVFPSPPSSQVTASPPPAKSLVCQWPGCTHSAPFATPAELMDHLSEEHIGRGKDHYVCQFGDCAALENGQGRSFRSRQKVLRHLQSHTGHRPYVCEECGQAFGEAAPLAAHMRRHAQEKPYACDYPGCTKRFAISSSLTIHMRTHNGEKPFICPHCNKGFVEASNLTKHIRTHTGERPFACTHPGCGKRFPRPDQLKRHMGVHEKEKEKEKNGVVKKIVKRRKISEAEGIVV